MRACRPLRRLGFPRWPVSTIPRCAVTNKPSSTPYVCFFFVNFDASPYRNVLRSFGVESAFKHELPFVETDVPREVLSYLKRTLNLVDVKVLPIQEAPAQVEAGKAGYCRMIAER